MRLCPSYFAAQAILCIVIENVLSAPKYFCAAVFNLKIVMTFGC